MYIEPCCAERQLHNLLTKERGHAALFQTSGDVTLEHMMKAVFLLSGNRPRTMTLAVPVFTENMQRFVARFLRSGWISSFRLLTAAAPVLDGFPAENTTTALDPSLTNNLLMFEGTDGTVVVQGPMLEATTPGLRLYAGTFGHSGSPVIRSFTDPLNAYFKSKKIVPSAAMPSQPKPKKNAKPTKKLAKKAPRKETATTVPASAE